MSQVFRAGPVAVGAAETTIATVPQLWSVSAKRLVFYNPTAGAITVTAHHVPSGGSAGTTNEVAKQSVGVNERFLVSGWGALAPGDVVSAIGSGAGLNAWFEGEVVTEVKATQ